MSTGRRGAHDRRRVQVQGYSYYGLDRRRVARRQDARREHGSEDAQRDRRMNERRSGDTRLDPIPPHDRRTCDRRDRNDRRQRYASAGLGTRRAADKCEVPGIIRRPAPTVGELRDALANLFEHCAMVHKHWGDNGNAREAADAVDAARALLARCEP